ncbi:MAG: hypothetical protein EOO89_15810 [Pedobacter sp.]|nr:MAG: hypothetical protein EOO89_15810 [Pedobacter sp.]
MNALKRILGCIWMLLGPIVIAFLFIQASEKIGLTHNETERTNTMLQWAIILFIFIPICTGLVIFGWYALKGEYDQVAEEPQP